jgi:flagellar protein FlaG
MRIDSMDASIRLVEHASENPIVDTSQKTMPQEDSKSSLVSEKFIINAIDKANSALIVVNRSLQFSVHDKTREIMVKVIDTETKEVVREIPSEKIMDMVASILEMAGILVDERR